MEITPTPLEQAKLHHDLSEGAYDFILSAADSEISSQADAFNQLDNKVGVTLGFALVAIVQLFTFVDKSMNAFGDSPLLVKGLILGSASSLFLATLFGVSSRWPRHFDDGWSPEELLELKKPDLIVLKDASLVRLRRSIDENYKVLRVKAR